MERSGRLGRPAEVCLGQAVGCDDLADQLQKGCDNGELGHRGRRRVQIGGVAEALQDEAHHIECDGQRRSQQTREHQSLEGEPEAVPLRVGNQLGDLAQTAPHGLAQEHDENQQESHEEAVDPEPVLDDGDGPQMFGRRQPTHRLDHVAGPGDERLGNTPRPQDVGEEEALDILESTEEVARNRAVLDKLIRVPSHLLNRLVEKILPHREEITDPLGQILIQLLAELRLQIEHRLPRQLVGCGSLLLVGDEPVLHLGDLFFEVSNRVGDGARLGEVSGHVRPPPGDAAPLPVGLELADGQLGDAVELRLVAAGGCERFRRLLGPLHEAI